jgi:hypothetical protein
MRAIGLVSLSIAIMALLLTDADAKRRSSAQGSHAAGASRSWCATYPGRGINDNCSYSSYNQCYQTVLGLGGFCRPNPFPGTAFGTGYSWSALELRRVCPSPRCLLTSEGMIERKGVRSDAALDLLPRHRRGNRKSLPHAR